MSSKSSSRRPRFKTSQPGAAQDPRDVSSNALNVFAGPVLGIGAGVFEVPVEDHRDPRLRSNLHALAILSVRFSVLQLEDAMRSGLPPHDRPFMTAELT